MKQKLILTFAGLTVLLSLLVFGTIHTEKSAQPQPEPEHTGFSITDHLKHAKEDLTSAQSGFLGKLENNITRGDVAQQKIDQYYRIADFWKDSIQSFEPYAYYLSEASKLENSQKKLTFAARLILARLRGEENVGIKTWEAETAADLFERALKLDPENDSLKVGLGSCYVYGKGMIGDAAETMKGIQTLLGVVRRDSANMQAQMVLGIGGVISRQYDKAIERLNKVVAAQPQNLEAVSWLADAYAATGDKKSAIEWYMKSKKIVNNPEYTKEVDERIKALQ